MLLVIRNLICIPSDGIFSISLRCNAFPVVIAALRWCGVMSLNVVLLISYYHDCSIEKKHAFLLIYA